MRLALDVRGGGERGAPVGGGVEPGEAALGGGGVREVQGGGGGEGEGGGTVAVCGVCAFGGECSGCSVGGVRGGCGGCSVGGWWCFDAVRVAVGHGLVHSVRHNVLRGCRYFFLLSCDQTENVDISCRPSSGQNEDADMDFSSKSKSVCKFK